MATGDRLLITVSEGARRLGVYHNAVNRWIDEGELEGFRVEGRRNRYVDAEQLKLFGLYRGSAGAESRTGRARDLHLRNRKARLSDGETL